MTEKLYWLSFASADKPEGQQFLGVIVVEANSINKAVVRTHLLGINPGGGVFVVILPETRQNRAIPQDTLLSRDDLVRLGLEPLYVEGLG